MVDANETPSPAEDKQSTPDASSQDATASIRSESVSASNISDQATNQDLLGFTPYVEAIAEFLTNDATRPPLTLSIEGGWGNGKSSFMQQLQEELEQIERRDNKHISKKVWFNAWRHDKVDALWAAFALEFLRQISKSPIQIDLLKPKTWRQIFNPNAWKEDFSNLFGHIKLLYLRFNWRENWQDFARVISLSVFLFCLALSLPTLFFIVGRDGINLLSNRIVCRLSPEEEAKEAREQDQCLDFEPESGEVSEIVLSILLWVGGFGGSATGAFALLVQVGKLIGDPKNDLKQYLESPDYKSKVAFIEKFHKDFKKIISAYVGKDNKVYVFIDDLDRCELTKAADLMQGLNLMISNGPSLIFILGMDREKVAAGIALKQEDVLPYLTSPSVVLDQKPQKDETSQKNESSFQGLRYAYHFIEKFVQLQFQMPKASEETFEYFVSTLSAKKATAVQSTPTEAEGQPPEPEGQLPEEKADSREGNQTSSVKSLLDRRETLKLDLTQDSKPVQDIILKVAPGLDYNPRRIKHFMNLFRLKAFIASNTGLFDELTLLSKDAGANGTKPENTTDPLTLEQLGKFTALCMKYPLLQGVLEEHPKLLKQLQQYSLDPNAANHSWLYDDRTKYWGSHSTLREILRAGCTLNDGNQQSGSNLRSYNLAAVDVKQLLQVSPFIEPIFRVPLRSEREVDYRLLRALLGAKAWEAADKETWSVMLKAAQCESQGYFNVSDIEKFPCQDLQTIDQLWVSASNGKFGFSVQKEIYLECGGIADGQHYKDALIRFFHAVDWAGKNYEISSPKGHLPNSSKELSWKRFVRRLGERAKAQKTDYVKLSDEPNALDERRDSMLILYLFSRIQTCKV